MVSPLSDKFWSNKFEKLCKWKLAKRRGKEPTCMITSIILIFQRNIHQLLQLILIAASSQYFFLYKFITYLSISDNKLGFLKILVRIPPSIGYLNFDRKEQRTDTRRKYLHLNRNNVQSHTPIVQRKVPLEMTENACGRLWFFFLTKQAQLA